jgi:hypothetical protein
MDQGNQQPTGAQPSKVSSPGTTGVQATTQAKPRAARGPSKVVREAIDAAINKATEDLSRSVKETENLVKIGFIVTVTATAAAVIGALLGLVAAIFSLMQFWSSPPNYPSGPVNSCAVVNPVTE